MPQEVLEKYTDYLYLPKRDYMLGLANWIGVTLVFGTLSLYFLSMSKSKPNESLFTVQDKHTRLGEEPPNAEELAKDPDQIAEIRDIPITVVNQVLYRKHS